MAEKRDSTDVAEAEEKVSEKHPKLDEPDDDDKPQDDNEEESDDDIYDNGAGYVDENIFGKYECKLSSIVIHIPALFSRIWTSSSKKTLRIWATFLLGKCWVLHIKLKTCSIVPTSNLCRNIQRLKNQLRQ